MASKRSVIGINGGTANRSQSPALKFKDKGKAKHGACNTSIQPPHLACRLSEKVISSSRPADRNTDDLKWTKQKVIMFVVCYLSFYTLGFVKVTLTVALPAVQRDSDVALSNADVAGVLASTQISYCIGKLFSGLLVDTLGSRHTLVLALYTCAISYVLTTSSDKNTLWPMYLGTCNAHFWCTACFPAMAKCAKAWFQGKLFAPAWAVLTTAGRIGAVSGSLALGMLLKVTGWQLVICCGGAVAASTATLVLICMWDAPQDQHQQHGTGAASKAAAHSKVPLMTALDRFARCPRFWLLLASHILLSPLIELPVLLPLYFANGVGLSPSEAGQAASVFPAAAVVSSLTAGNLYGRLTPSARVLFVTSLMLVAVASFGYLSTKSATDSVTNCCAALFAANFGITVPFSIVGFPWLMHISGPFAGTLMGLADCPCFIIGAVFVYVYPKLVELGGWPLVFRVCQVMAAAALCVHGVFLHLERKRPTKPLV